MKKEIKSRREALGLLGKAGISLGIAPYFFVSLKLSAMSGTDFNAEISEDQQTMRSAAAEKAVISGSDSKLTVTISGKPGRYFFVAVSDNDIRKNYGAFPESKGIISSRGSGSVVVDLKKIDVSRIYIKIVTAETDKFNSELAETEAFVIRLNNGVIDTFEGVVSRPVIEKTDDMVTLATAATVCSVMKSINR